VRKESKFKNQLNVGYVNGYADGVAVVSSFDVRATPVNEISLRLIWLRTSISTFVL